MNDIFDILKQINELTLKIEFRYPELYRNLEEMPMKQKNQGGREVDPHALYDYLVNLRSLVTKYETTHLSPIGIKT